MRFFTGVRRRTSYCAGEMRIFGEDAPAALTIGRGGRPHPGPHVRGYKKIPGSEEPGIGGAPEGIRTPNLLIRSQMLYPLSYRRMFLASDFFNPSRQQVILYGGYEGPASRKTQKGPIFGSPECCNASFYREIPGFLVPGKFFKIFLCGSKREVGSLRGDSPSRAILTLRPSNFSLITLGVFLLKV